MSHHHIYTALQAKGKQELRLVTLLSSPCKDAPIECNLSIGNLEDQNLRYEALSYEWGDPNGPRYDILLDGQPFTVRRNLWHALRCLRTEFGGRTLWVDAICINQENVSERNHQVGMMGHIYRSATSVRVWLGETSNNSREAILLLHEIFESFEEVSRPSQEAVDKANELRKKLAERRAEPATPPSKFDRFEELPLLPMVADELSEDSEVLLFKERQLAWLSRMAGASELAGPWEGIAALVERTYWNRIWIVQEYLLANQTIVQCGWDYMDGVRFDKAISIIAELAELKRPPCLLLPQSIQRSLDRIANGPGVNLSKSRTPCGQYWGCTLLQLLETCKKSKSCDPHDRIYAILGLAGDLPPNAIMVDYERSIFKVKMDVVWWYATNSVLKSRPASISHVCSLLDEIFADCDDED
jgi:hypothetical protein